MCFAYCLGGNASEPPKKRCRTVENASSDTLKARPIDQAKDFTEGNFVFDLGKGANVECSPILASPGAPNVVPSSKNETLQERFLQELAEAIRKLDLQYFDSIKQKSIKKNKENSKDIDGRQTTESTTSKKLEECSTSQIIVDLGKGAKVECSPILASPGAPAPLTRKQLVNELAEAIRTHDSSYFDVIKDRFTQKEIDGMYQDDCRESAEGQVTYSKEEWFAQRLARIFKTTDSEK